MNDLTLKAEQEKVVELQKENKALIKENKKLAKKVATVQDEYVRYYFC